MLVALVVLPALVAALGWWLGTPGARRVLLPGTAFAHLAATGFLWWLRPGPALGGWIALDALGLLVLTVTSLVFAAVALFATAYLDRRQGRGERAFVTCLLAFLAAATLVTVSQHLALLWIGMEATTLAMAPLVFYRRTRRSLEAVWKYLLLSSVGIALALFGTFFLAAAQGAGQPLVVGELVAHADALQPGLLRAAFAFLLVGYGTKMGLAPVHAWKPDTYGEAPNLVAALMAGALTSCAFLGLARATQVMVAAHQLAFARPALLALGLASLVISAAFMIGQSDLKRLFAYSSIEHMGLLAIALAVGGVGSWGAALHLVNNGLVKAALFLAAGNVVLLAGTSEAAAVGGLARRAPWTAVLLFCGLLAVTGSPPFGMFPSEFAILGGVARAGYGWLALVMVVLLAIVFVSMGRMILRMVVSEAAPDAPRLVEPFRRVAGPVVLAALVLMMGLWLPGPLREALAQAATLLGGRTP